MPAHRQLSGELPSGGRRFRRLIPGRGVRVPVAPPENLSAIEINDFSSPRVTTWPYNPALDTQRRRLRNRAPTAAGWGERREWAAVVDHAIHTHPHNGCINDVPIAAVRVAFTVAVSRLA